MKQVPVDSGRSSCEGQASCTSLYLCLCFSCDGSILISLSGLPSSNTCILYLNTPVAPPSPYKDTGTTEGCSSSSPVARRASYKKLKMRWSLPALLLLPLLLPWVTTSLNRVRGYRIGHHPMPHPTPTPIPPRTSTQLNPWITRYHGSEFDPWHELVSNGSVSRAGCVTIHYIKFLGRVQTLVVTV